MMGLTKRQGELLRFIQAYAKENDAAPSYDEMREAMGLASKSCVHVYLVALEKYGLVRRWPHRARAIELMGAASPYSEETLAGLTRSQLSDLIQNAGRILDSQAGRAA